ncbi:MAG TPA: metallophosphoesterase family protein [Bryobacteraceae bacterium]|nr:metallophosphoesterase family protein [Bryobacteraceae bacterium]
MRFLILSDIHANWDALDAVLNQAEGQYDIVLNCGDLVGYGPEPNRVVDWCRATNAAVVRGNHDRAAVGLTDLEWFNPIAKAAALWTAEILTEDNRLYLANLPIGPVTVQDFAILHGSPDDEDEYLVNVSDVEQIEPERTLSFFGHTHLQGGFELHRNGPRHIAEASVFVDDTTAYLLNPGSVGQPRDRDPRAAYAIYDSEQRRVNYHRSEYNVGLAAQKIFEAGLPEVLGMRLFRGT